MKKPIIAEAKTTFGKVVVKFSHTHYFLSYYNVYVDRKLKHPTCTSEDVMRVLAHYLQSSNHLPLKRRGRKTKMKR